MDSSIIIPTYNEKKNILLLLDQIKEVMKGKYEIIVVDDDSPDKTVDVVSRYSKKNRNVRVIRRKERGLSSAVVRGFDVAKGDALAVIDADLSHDPAILPELLQGVKDGYDIVVGSRRIRGGGADTWPFHRRLTSNIATGIAKMLLDVPLCDPMSGYFAIRRKVFEQVRSKLNPKGYKIMLELCMRSKTKNVKEIPFVFKDRKQGHSKLGMRIILQYIGMVYGLVKGSQ